MSSIHATLRVKKHLPVVTNPMKMGAQSEFRQHQIRTSNAESVKSYSLLKPKPLNGSQVQVNPSLRGSTIQQRESMSVTSVFGDDSCEEQNSSEDYTQMQHKFNAKRITAFIRKLRGRLNPDKLQLLSELYQLSLVENPTKPEIMQSFQVQKSLCIGLDADKEYKVIRQKARIQKILRASQNSRTEEHNKDSVVLTRPMRQKKIFSARRIGRQLKYLMQPDMSAWLKTMKNAQTGEFKNMIVRFYQFLTTLGRE